MMESPASGVDLTDHSPEVESFQTEILRGLANTRKTLPCKYFYDARGSELFDRICELEEYYPTRTELAIMQEHIQEMVACLGPRCLLVEFGSGSSLKTTILLDHLIDPVAYVPIDISRDHLAESAARLSSQYPDLEVRPVSADYTGPFELPSTGLQPERTAVYFPGSTIGNFEPDDARRFLRRMASISGPGGALLIGIDLQKDRSTLEDAYNDESGVTAAFNKNLLLRMNRELGADFDLDRFEHQAIYNAEEGRIEMYLISTEPQGVQVGGQKVHFARGERIRTEYSYKYTIKGFAELARSAGFQVENVWTDANEQFSVHYCATA